MSDSRGKIQWYPCNRKRKLLFYPMVGIMLFLLFNVFFKLYRTPIFSVGFYVIIAAAGLGLGAFLYMIYLYKIYMSDLFIGVSHFGIYFRYKKHIEHIPWKAIEKIVPVTLSVWNGKEFSKKRRLGYGLVLNDQVITVSNVMLDNKKAIDEILKMYEEQKATRE